MSIKLGVVMDPLHQINIKKDSTFAMMLAAQARQWEIFYIEPKNLRLNDGRVFARCQKISVKDKSTAWFTVREEIDLSLSELNIVLMRKDPPFDIEYIYTTHLLDFVEAAGVLVVNKPQSLRDANEKLFTNWFPQCCPPTVVTRDHTALHAFIAEHKTVILKPLSGMGGASVFKVEVSDPNKNVILETLTQHGQQFAMAQRFIPEVATTGDKRILLVDGQPIPYALARMPAAGEVRANLAVGGTGVGVPLTKRDEWICEQIASMLRKKGLWFVGIDVIGDYLTEINVTSPTCIRELDHFFRLDIAGTLLDRLLALHLQNT